MDLKQDRKGYNFGDLKLQSYIPDKRLCIVHYLKEYLARTNAYRMSKQLFLTYKKPYGPASLASMSRWVKSVLLEAGISSHFGPGSIRSASTSKAFLKGLPLDQVLQAGGWRRRSTFNTYYNKPIMKEGPGFGQVVLDGKN